MIINVLSILVSGARLIIPPFANDFLRKSRIEHLVGLITLFIGFSCSAKLNSNSIESFDEKSHEISGPYPIISSSNTGLQEDLISEEQWQCGYEVIVVTGPAGEVIYVEVPLPCDPLADVYKGCPEDEKALENKQ